MAKALIQAMTAEGNRPVQGPVSDRRDEMMKPGEEAAGGRKQQAPKLPTNVIDLVAVFTT